MLRLYPHGLNYIDEIDCCVVTNYVVPKTLNSSPCCANIIITPFETNQLPHHSLDRYASPKNYLYHASPKATIFLYRLTVTLKTLFNLSIFLVQPLPPLLWQGVLVSITGVVSCQNIDRGIQSRETGLSSNLGKSPVITHEVNHLLLEILSKVLHTVGPLGKSGSGDHVSANSGGIGFIAVGEAPVWREYVLFWLLGDDNFGWCDGWEKDGWGGSGGGCLEELTTGRLLVLKREGKN